MDSNYKFQIGDSVRIKNVKGRKFIIVARIKQLSFSFESHLEDGSNFEVKNDSKGCIYKLNDGSSQWFHEELLEKVNRKKDL